MKKIRLIICYMRMLFFKFIHLDSRISFKGFSDISAKTIFELGEHSILSIGRGLHTRAGVVLAVRENSSLIIGESVFINRNTIITARKYIRIEDCVTIGPNVCIYDHDHDMKQRGGYVSDNVVVRRNAWIGANVVILKGVTIGENAVIASGSIVTKDVPANQILIQKRNNQYYNIG